MIILLVILAIVAICGVAVTTAMRKGLDPQDSYDRRRRKMLGIVRVFIAAGCAAVAALAMLIGGIKIMDQTEVGIVKVFGKVDHTISGGLNFVNPISDTVEVMDLRVHVREAAFASYTKDAQPLTASIEYQYEPIAAQAMNIVAQYGSYEIMEQKLSAAVEERAKIVFARYSAMPLLENRSTLSTQVQEEVRDGVVGGYSQVERRLIGEPEVFALYFVFQLHERFVVHRLLRGVGFYILPSRPEPRSALSRWLPEDGELHLHGSTSPSSLSRLFFS